MELDLITAKPDFSLFTQKQLYYSHPYSKDFVEQMSVLVEDGHLPRFVTLAWLSWWFLQQNCYVRVFVQDNDQDCILGCKVLLENNQLTITYYEGDEEGNSYEIDLPEKKDYTAICASLWINQYEPHTPWIYLDTSMDFIAQSWKPQLTKENVEIRIRGNELDFEMTPNLFLRDKAVCQAFLRLPANDENYPISFARTANDYLLNLPNLKVGGWWQRKDARYRYFITKVNPLKFDFVYNDVVLIFEFEFIIVLE